jgi:hypothetical protein
MVLRIATVADSISKLSVAGLTISDIDAIKAAADTRISTMIPNADYITDVVSEVDSYGASVAMMTLYYTLNYRLLYKPLGTGRTMTLEQFSGLVAMVGLIWDAFLDIGEIAGCEDLSISSVGNFGPVEDPAGSGWWGCDLGFRVKEFVR